MRRSGTTGAVIAAIALATAAVGCGETAGGAGDSQDAGDEVDEASETGGGEEGETLSGEFEPLGDSLDRDVSGEATLTRTHGRTSLSVDVTGLQPDAAHPAHLHEGTCADQGPHYQHDPEGAEEPPNELWPSSAPNDPTAGLQADADGQASGSGTAGWRAEGPLSVFVHAAGQGHDKIACADLEER